MDQCSASQTKLEYYKSMWCIINQCSGLVKRVEMVLLIGCAIAPRGSLSRSTAQVIVVRFNDKVR